MPVGSNTTHIGLKDVGALLEDPTIVKLLAVHAEQTKGVKRVDLAKVWQINVDTARRTLDIITQIKHREMDGNLYRNFSTNNSMLRY